jgi:hypothetical protein
MSVTIDYLIPFLRMRLGDINPDSYRYADEWLLNALIFGVKLSARYWNNRYMINENGVVTRGPNTTFLTDEASYGTIEDRDEPVIVLLSTIVLLEGSLENSAYSITSWKDAEISFSNLESGRIRDSNLNRLYTELNMLVTAPTKKLARTIKGSLPGYNPIGSVGYEKTDF